MKKFFFPVIATLLYLNSFAQVRTIKFEVTLTAPANGASIPKETPFEQKFIIKNLGPAAIKPTDTIGFIDPATADGSYFLRIGYTKAVGDTIQINRSGYSFPSSASAGPTNYCVLAFAQNQKDTVNFDTTGRTFQDCNTITITPPTGIAELFKESGSSRQLGISPNPAHAEVNLDFTAASNAAVVTRVYDLTGRIVLSKNYDQVSTGDKGFGLDLTSLKQGTYFVELQQDGNRYTGKLVKQ